MAKRFPEINEQKKPAMTERLKQSILEQLWLTYYNDTLFAEGVITEEEHNKMRVKIKTRAVTKGHK